MTKALKIEALELFWMDTQSLVTIATPFLVFGGVFAVLLLVWDRD